MSSYRKTFVTISNLILLVATVILSPAATGVLPAGWTAYIVLTVALVHAFLVYLVPNDQPVPVTAAEVSAAVTVVRKLADGTEVKLGRLPFVADARDFVLARYLDRAAVLPTIPPSVDNSAVVKRWLMLLNDKLGDCTIAAALHFVMLVTRLSKGRAFTATNPEALRGYEGACGYVNGDPSTDQGGNERDVLTYWRKTGFGAKTSPHKILAFVKVAWTDLHEMLAATYLFGGVYIGVNLQEAQMTQQTWDYVPGSAVAGGHAVIIVAVNADGSGKLISWGQVFPFTAAWLQHTCEEAWTVLSPDLLNAQGSSPAGLNLTQLQADLAAL